MEDEPEVINDDPELEVNESESKVESDALSPTSPPTDASSVNDEHVEVNLAIVNPPAAEPVPDPDPEPEAEADWKQEIRETEGRIMRRIDDLCEEILDLTAAEEAEAETGDGVVEVPAEPEVPASEVETPPDETPKPKTRQFRHRFGRR